MQSGSSAKLWAMAKGKRSKSTGASKSQASDTWVVVYDPRATKEFAEAYRKDKGLAVPIEHAIEKLVALGPKLPWPHSSNVEGDQTGLRELRPGRGDSAYRPLYRRFGRFFVILGLAHKSSFAKDVRTAAARGRGYEDS